VQGNIEDLSKHHGPLIPEEGDEVQNDINRLNKKMLHDGTEADARFLTIPTNFCSEKNVAYKIMDERYQTLHGIVQYSSSLKQEDTLELTIKDAFGFLVCSSIGLLILFYLKIYTMAKVMYTLGCSTALFHVLILPLFQYVFPISIPCFSSRFIKYLSILTAYGLGLFWLYTSLIVLHPGSLTFFLIIQNIMGTCVCISFLSTIHLNELKVATVLLTLALSYDVFMVFLTPLLTHGHKSIMVDVATSGGLPRAGPEWCEKYPNDISCLGGEPFPVLFTVPRFGDYRGGTSLLGLGDVVLPGLLLALAARTDASIKMIRRYSLINGRKVVFRGGYFIPVCVFYGIGLVIANLGVYTMEEGQPALLYLVPCCLGSMLIMAWMKNDLTRMWKTNIYINTANDFLNQKNM